MHAKGTVHGDCKASNCPLRLKPLAVKWGDLGLGLAVMANSQIAGNQMYSSLPPSGMQARENDEHHACIRCLGVWACRLRPVRQRRGFEPLPG